MSERSWLLRQRSSGIFLQSFLIWRWHKFLVLEADFCSLNLFVKSPCSVPYCILQLVCGFKHFLYFSMSYMGCHPSHWRTLIFQRGRSTTNQAMFGASIELFLMIQMRRISPWSPWRIAGVSPRARPAVGIPSDGRELSARNAWGFGVEDQPILGDVVVNYHLVMTNIAMV